MKCWICNGTGKVNIKKMPLAGRLKFAREASGLSLREVETKTGINSGLLCRYETGHKKNPSFEIIMKLCKLYGIAAEELW